MTISTPMLVTFLVYIFGMVLIGCLPTAPPITLAITFWADVGWEAWSLPCRLALLI